MAFRLESPAFAAGDEIPRRHVRDGDNLSPPLTWTDPPAGTRSFMLIVEDPDAPSGTFRHWGVYNIASHRVALPEGATFGKGTVPAEDTETLSEGVNDFGNARYDGPQPPKAHGVHHYHFRLAALDVEQLEPAETAGVEQIWAGVQSHVLGEAELIGTFENR